VVRLCALIAAFVAIAAAAAAAQPSSAPAASDAALAKYRAALDALPTPGAVVFEYTESRIGPSRALAEVHRVYRDAGGEERNETISVDGEPVVPAIARFSTSAVWPYDVRAFAVEETDYVAMPLGVAVVAGKRTLSFSTVRTTVGDFSVTQLYLDPTTHLPVREKFNAQGSGCVGSGSIDFGPVDHRWMPSTVSVSCSVPPGDSTFKETIKFGDYQFLSALPSDVFGGNVP
jgi:hypothetical protein